MLGALGKRVESAIGALLRVAQTQADARNAIGAVADSEAVKLTGNQTVAGVKTYSNQQRWAKGADIASANALALGTDGNYFDVTGTTAITSISTVGVGTIIKLHFDGALTLTHNATDLILPGGANITTAAGDEAEFVEYAAGDWRCTVYTKANGAPLVSSVPVAGDVLQVVTDTDAGTTTTSTSLTNMNAGNKSITPKNSSSKILIEVSFRASVEPVASTNATGSFQIYDVTGAAAVGAVGTINSLSGAGGSGAYAPAVVRAIVTNTVTTARAFQMRGATNNASGAAGCRDMVWSFTEIKT